MRAGEVGGRSRSDPEVILWQSMVRVALAATLAGIATLLMLTRVYRGSPFPLLLAVGVYCLWVLGVRAYVRRTQRAGVGVAVAMMLGDLAAVFVSVISSTPPQYYEQILLLAFVVLHFTEFAFGALAAAWSVVTTAAAFCGVIWFSIRRGAPLQWAEELWSVGVYVLAAVAFLYQYGDLKRRLRRLVQLFEHAAAGDYSGEYDVYADRRPDAITRVGRAYNRFRAQLTSLVLEDPLSGCYNRRGFHQLLAAELARTARTGGEVALLAVDLDNFKAVNDRFGHLVGDRVIRETGTLLKATARTNDVVARVGGEEFLVLTPDTDADGALHLAERVLEAFRATRFGGRDASLAVTASVGVVADRVSGAGTAHVEDLLARADEALYSAKRGGRDRVVVWRPAVRVEERARRLG